MSSKLIYPSDVEKSFEKYGDGALHISTTPSFSKSKYCKYYKISIKRADTGSLDPLILEIPGASIDYGANEIPKENIATATPNFGISAANVFSRVIRTPGGDPKVVKRCEERLGKAMALINEWIELKIPPLIVKRKTDDGTMLGPIIIGAATEKLNTGWRTKAYERTEKGERTKNLVDRVDPYSSIFFRVANNEDGVRKLSAKILDATKPNSRTPEKYEEASAFDEKIGKIVPVTHKNMHLFLTRGSKFMCTIDWSSGVASQQGFTVKPYVSDLIIVAKAERKRTAITSQPGFELSVKDMVGDGVYEPATEGDYEPEPTVAEVRKVVEGRREVPSESDLGMYEPEDAASAEIIDESVHEEYGYDAGFEPEVDTAPVPAPAPAPAPVEVPRVIIPKTEPASPVRAPAARVTSAPRVASPAASPAGKPTARPVAKPVARPAVGKPLPY